MEGRGGEGRGGRGLLLQGLPHPRDLNPATITPYVPTWSQFRHKYTILNGCLPIGVYH